MKSKAAPPTTAKKKFRSIVHTLTLVAALIVASHFAWTGRNYESHWRLNPSEMPAAADGDQVHPSPHTLSAGPEHLWVLTEALLTNQTTDTDTTDARLAEQLALAEQRAVLMSELMAEDPAQALALSLTFAEYAALPEAVQKRVERPFSVKGNLSVFPVCPEGKPGQTGSRAGRVTASYEVWADGNAEGWRSYLQGRRGASGAKEGIPLQGFALRGRAVIRDEAMQVLDSANAEAARAVFGMAVANADPARDFLTGEPIAAEPVTAAAGGRLYLFAHPANVERLNEELALMDEKPGPYSGSQVLFQPVALNPASIDGGGFALEKAWAAVQMAATSWTETRKKVYVIRVDFPDLTGEAVSKSTIETVFNTSVSNQIFNMSYGKTWTEATASSIIVRMPGGTNVYRGENNSLLHSNAVTAFNASGTGVNLANYDIICVAFKNIGMTSGGINYGGVGNGGQMWLQNSFNGVVITHEAGHNYGLAHASFWQTTDGSVVGTGSRIEYGDDFDIMGAGPIPQGHFHMQGKSLLNWLTTNQWTRVSTSGTYRVYRIDDRTTTPAFSRGLRITKAAAPTEYYWAGYRRAFTSNPYLNNGACLLWQRPGQNRSELLDTTPGSADGKSDSALLIGRTYSDTVANVHITPIANGGAGADEWLDITVNLGPFPGNRPPAVGPLTGPATLSARTTAIFAVAATDPDGDALAYSWDFGDGTLVMNTASLTHNWAVGGNYTVRVVVSDMKGQVVTKTLAVTVSDPLTQWTARVSLTTADLQDICAGTNGAGIPIVLAVGYSNNFDAKVCLSTNGSEWTSGPFNEANVRMKSVVYNGQRFIAAGWVFAFSVNDWVGGIWTSVDGTGNAWTRRYSNDVANTALEGLAANGQTAVAVGESGRILYSTNGGNNWTMASSTATRKFHDVVWGGSRFVAVGGEDNGTLVQVFTSSNGIQWVETTAGSGVETSQNLMEVEYGNDRFLASGSNSKIRHSTDGGISFQTTRTTTEEIRGFAFGKELFFAAGVDKANANADINLVSTDGAFWTPLVTPAQNMRNAAVFFRDTFITVGDGGAIWQSAAVSAPVTTTRGPLTMTRSGPNVIVSWPAGLQGSLQESRRLAPATWSNSPSGTNHPVTLPSTNAATFYRLVLMPGP